MTGAPPASARTDLRRVAIEGTEIVAPPGRSFVYNPYNTLLLGLALERATGEAVSDYMAENLWGPIGAEATATWSLDSEESGFEKMESGLNGRAIDLARLGLLYVRHGRVQGSQVVAREWIREATAVDDSLDPSSEYGYHWWTHTDKGVGDWHLALGNKGQFIAVFPSLDLVIARFGVDFGYEGWPELFPQLARAISG